MGNLGNKIEAALRAIAITIRQKKIFFKTSNLNLVFDKTDG